MKTKLMRAVVWDTKAILKSNDFKFKRIENRALMTGVAKTLNESHRDNPRTTAAIIHFLEDHGFDLRSLACLETQAAVSRKDKVLEGISPEDSARIKTVCASLFSQYVKLT